MKEAWDETIPESKRRMAIYAASKIEAEKEAWKWMESEERSFEFNSVLPSFTVSQILTFFSFRLIRAGWKSTSPRDLWFYYGSSTQVTRGR